MPVSHTGVPARSAKPVDLLGSIWRPGSLAPRSSSVGGSFSGGSPGSSMPSSGELELPSSGSSAAHPAANKVRHAVRRAGFVIFVLLAQSGRGGAVHRPYHSQAVGFNQRARRDVIVRSLADDQPS